MRVVTDAVSLEFLRGAVIEFEDSLMRSAFKVRGEGLGAAARQHANVPLQTPRALHHQRILG
jgi:hypothetical protein